MTFILCVFIIRKDGIVAEVFDHLMDVLIDICRNDSARLQAEEIFNKYRIYLFDDMASNKMVSFITFCPFYFYLPFSNLFASIKIYKNTFTRFFMIGCEDFT